MGKLADGTPPGSTRSPSGWKAKLKGTIPSYGESLIDDAKLCSRVRAETAAVLHLQND